MRKDLGWMGIAAVAVVMAACGDDSGGGGGSGGATASSTSTGSPTSSGTATTSSASSSSGTSTSTSSAGDGGTGPTGSGGGGSGPGGSGGEGGGPDLDKDPATVTDPAECYYEGEGGANEWGCSAAVIELSDPIPRDEITISVEASDGTVFEELVAGSPDAWSDEPAFYADDPVTTLTLRYSPGGAESEVHYAPEWIDVEIRRGDVLVGAERFEPLEYACIALSQDDWCWESAPVTLEITNPE